MSSPRQLVQWPTCVVPVSEPNGCPVNSSVSNAPARQSSRRATHVASHVEEQQHDCPAEPHLALSSGARRTLLWVSGKVSGDPYAALDHHRGMLFSHQQAEIINFVGLATAGVPQRNLAVPERWAWPLRNPSRNLGASEVEDT